MRRGGLSTHGWSTKQTKTSTKATPTERRAQCLVWRDKRGGDRRTKAGPFSRRRGSYIVSGSGGLPGPFLSQQVFDRVLDPDALVDPLGIIWNKDTGGESPKQSENSWTNFPPAPQTRLHLNASQFYSRLRTMACKYHGNVMEAPCKWGNAEMRAFTPTVVA